MHRLACLLLLTACGPVLSPEPARTIAQYRSGLDVGAAGGCDTSIASGLSAQLVEELNCVTPNLMVNFSGPHVTLYSAVIPFLAPGAAQDLKDATVARNDRMTVSSAYRTLAQQALLYRWWQAGQCGIQVAAVPGSSNHQSGRAIDTPSYSTWKSALSAQGWSWLGSNDVVHFDHNASPNISAKSILAFQRLWNRNHTTGKLSEDGQWGPNTSSAMNQSPVTGFPVYGCATTGKLAGVVTQQGSGAPLAGVAVTVGSTTLTTSASGAFEFTLPPGAVTLTASKSGFTTTSLTRTVQAGSTVSGSLSLSPVNSTATLSGTVVEAANPAQGVVGAAVSVGGQQLVSGANGAFQATLPAGTFTLVVSRAGFEVSSTQVTLVAGVVKTVQVALVASSSDLPPVLTVDSPASGASADFARLVLLGSAVDDLGPITAIVVVQNQGAPVTVPLNGGQFEVELLLVPGENTVELSATDSAGQRTQVRWRGTFRAGFSGLVHRFDDAAAIVPDAELTLFQPDTGALLTSTRADVAGRFELNVEVLGVLRLHVEKAGYTPRDLLVQISSDERTEVDVGLTPGNEAGIRFIEPADEGPFESDEVLVSGVVTGFEVAAVTVNGVPAVLLGNGFVAHVPLPEGRTELVAVAEGSGGQTVQAATFVRRPMSAVVGGCSAAPGLGLLVLLVSLKRRARTQRRS